MERFNRMFAEMLSMYVDSSHDNWDESIDYVTFGYDTGRQESTKFNSFYLLYDREALLPIYVALGNNPNPVPIDHTTESVQQFVKRLSNMLIRQTWDRQTQSSGGSRLAKETLRQKEAEQKL